VEAQKKVSIEVAEQVRDFFEKGEIRNAVNAPRITLELLQILKPYLPFLLLLSKICTTLHQGFVEEVEFSFQGEMAKLETPYLTQTLLKTILKNFVEGPVNEVNALKIAEERGIRVRSLKISQPQDYLSAVKISLKGKEETTLIGGAFVENRRPKLIQINEFSLEFTLENGSLLLILNKDVPGVIGRIGTILGEMGINIGQMHVGRTPLKKGTALTVVSVDTPPPQILIERLKKEENIVRVLSISL